MNYNLVGIDPGWKNLGYAVVSGNHEEDYRITVLDSAVLNPSATQKLPVFVEGLIYRTKDLIDDARHCSIERYVAYQGVHSADAENINKLIGMLEFAYYGCLIQATVFRAIDWKTKLVQLLSKHTGFQNPSMNLDKKFSIAAAKALLKEPYEIKTDHEADAICIAAFPLVRAHFEAKESKKAKAPAPKR